ncbi:hypothetical protein EVAR_37510_1 [Eumeta japonica]|uniref:Uncharacterized protein n=1 Tax=Eumeta variegata TaxID=151549 RepID=A0A4C1XDH3_EUMVA|nr:hypothetical protein EVAR_37510_1 [Eumeta japonica]
MWVHMAGFYVVGSALLRAQRPALVLIIKAYRSTSMDALTVLAEILPADFEVARCGKMESHKHGNTAREMAAFKKSSLCEEPLKRILAGALDRRGEGTKRLYDMRLNERKDCDYGWTDETRDHVLWDYPLYDKERLDGMFVG